MSQSVNLPVNQYISESVIDQSVRKKERKKGYSVVDQSKRKKERLLSSRSPLSSTASSSLSMAEQEGRIPWAVNSPCTRSNASAHSAATAPGTGLEELPPELESGLDPLPLLLLLVLVFPAPPLREGRCFLVPTFSPSPFVVLSLPALLPTTPVPVPGPDPDPNPGLDPDPDLGAPARPPPSILRR